MFSSHPFPDTRPSLIVKLRDGGSHSAPAAWHEFFERYAPPVFRVARRYGLSHQDADDIVQQTMLAVCSHIGGFSYDRDRGQFRQWVKTIATNNIRNLLRRTKAMHQVQVQENSPEPELPSPTLKELWEDEWRLQDLQYCLDRVRREISPVRYEAFEMYVLKGVSAEDTAEKLGLTRTHVYVTRNRVVKRIRAFMDELVQD